MMPEEKAAELLLEWLVGARRERSANEYRIFARAFSGRIRRSDPLSVPAAPVRDRGSCAEEKGSPEDAHVGQTYARASAGATRMTPFREATQRVALREL